MADLRDELRWNSLPVVAVAALLFLAFAAGSYIQLVTLEKLKLVVLTSMENVSAYTLASGAFARTALAHISHRDWAVIGFAVLLLAGFIIAQARYGAFSAFLQFILARESRTIGLVLFFGLLTLKPILIPGAPYFMDAPAHVSRAWFTYVNLAQGYAFPSFTNYYHNGFALFSHYGWLPSYIIALANFAIRNINAASKVVVFILSLANVLLFYFLGKKIFSSRRAGLLLSLIFSASSIYLYEILWSGLTFYPFVFFGIGVMLFSYESWMSGSMSPFPAALVAAAGSAIIVNTHLGYAAQSLLFFAVYTIARTAVFQPRRLGRFLGYGVMAAAMGAVLGAFVFLPTKFDIGDVNFFKGFPFSDRSTYAFWRRPLWQLLLPRPFYMDFGWDYMGLALVGAAAVFIVGFLRAWHKWFLFSLILLAFSLSVIGYPANSLLLFLSLAFLVAGGYAFLREKNDVRLGALAVLAIALICDCMLFNNFNTTDTRGGTERAVYNRLEREPDGTRYGVVMANTLHTGNDTGNDVFVSPWLKLVGHVVMQPNAIMLEANKQALYQYGFSSDLLVPDIRAGRVSAATIQALDLIGVKYITFHNLLNYFVPSLQADEGTTPHPEGPWIELPLTSPVLYAPSAVNASSLEATMPALKNRAAFEADDISHNRAPFHTRPDADAYLRAVVAAIGLDPRTASAKQFLLRSGMGEMLADPGPAAVAVSRYQVDSQKVQIDFSIDKRGFVAVPFGYFKYHRVMLDGQPATFFPTVINTICVKVAEPGRHTLTVGPSISPSRRVGALISSAGLILFLLILLAVRLLRSRRPSST
jgi:hypothetical protein